MFCFGHGVPIYLVVIIRLRVEGLGRRVLAHNFGSHMDAVQYCEPNRLGLQSRALGGSNKWIHLKATFSLTQGVDKL